MLPTLYIYNSGNEAYWTPSIDYSMYHDIPHQVVYIRTHCQ